MMNSIGSQNTTAQVLDPPTVVRVIRWYEKNGEQLRGESVLADPSLSELQSLFGESTENPMYDCYPISGTQAAYFQTTANLTINMALYDYYLECDTT